MYRPFYLPEYSALYFATGSISSESVFSGACNVFVCGALQDPIKMSALLGLEPPFAPAAATGYRRTVERIDGKDIPFMVPDQDDPRSVLTGVVWLDLAREASRGSNPWSSTGDSGRESPSRPESAKLEVTAYTYVKK